MKKFKSLLIIAILFIITGCDKNHTVTYFEVLDITINELSYDDTPKIYYFGSLEELNKLNTQIFQKYNDEYFETKSLALITLKDYEQNTYNSPYIFNGSIGFTRNVVSDDKTIDRILLLEIKEKANDLEKYTIIFNDETLQTKHVCSFVYTIVEPTCFSDGYTRCECICGYSPKKDFIEYVECQFENGECKWCKFKEPTHNYKISKNSTRLMRATIDLYYAEAYIFIDYNIFRYILNAEKDQIDHYNYVDLTAEFDDYYTCCYLNKDKKELLDSVKEIDLTPVEDAYYEQAWGMWSGINYYLGKFFQFYYYQGGMYKESSLIKYKDIKWFEIPKDEEIPEELDNYFLIAIMESKTVVHKSLLKENQEEYKWYFEAKHMYNDGLNYPNYEEFYNELINQKYIITYNWGYAKSSNDKGLNGWLIYKRLKPGVKIKTIDGIDYLGVSTEKRFDPYLKDFLEILDLLDCKVEVLKDGTMFYWYKYDDIMSIANWR